MDVKGIDTSSEEKKEKVNIYSQEYRDSWRDRVPEGIQEGDTVKFKHGKTDFVMEGQVLNYRQDGRVLDILTNDGEQYTLKATRGSFTIIKKREEKLPPWDNRPHARLRGEVLPGDILSKRNGGQYTITSIETSDGDASSWYWEAKNETTGKTEFLDIKNIVNMRVDKYGEESKEFLAIEQIAETANSKEELQKAEDWLKKKGWIKRKYQGLQWKIDHQRRVLQEREQKQKEEEERGWKEERQRERREEREDQLNREYGKHSATISTARKDLKTIEADLATTTTAKGYKHLLDRLGNISDKVRKDTPLGADKEFASWSKIDVDMERTLAKISHGERDSAAQRKARKGSRRGKTYLDERFEVYGGNKSLPKGLQLPGWPRFGDPEHKPVITTARSAMIVKSGTSPGLDGDIQYAIEKTPYEVTAITPVRDHAIRVQFREKETGEVKRTYLRPMEYYELKAIAGPGAKVYPTGEDRPVFFSGKNGTALLAPLVDDHLDKEAKRYS